MKLKLDTSLAKHYMGDRVLYIFSNIPYWFVANNKFDSIMGNLEKGVQSEEFFSKLGPNTKLLVDDLIKNGIISQDGKKVDIKRITPNKRIWEVYDALELELTLDCNLRCKHCYIDAGNSKGEEISLNEGINNIYLTEGKLNWSMLDGYWKDAGTFKTLAEVNKYWSEKEQN